MTTRKLSPLDHFLAGADNALRTVAGAATCGSRPNPASDLPDNDLQPGEKARSAGLMRVNHAGEVAAQALYQGHAAVARDPLIAGHMRTAADEERDHLAWCAERLRELGYGPSRLSPVWFAGAWLIGAASGALGDRWSLGFVAETEHQVAEHLEGHLGKLPAADQRSRAIVRRMRDEEVAHGAGAIKKGAARLPRPVRELMRISAGIMTRTAYWL
jgi:ubiquinone biosynthesis monooxygenase Coq7